MFLAVARRRTGQRLLGTIDGTNVTFTVPNNEKFVNMMPASTIAIYLNGLRLSQTADYNPQESFGPSTGFDQVVFTTPPVPGDYLLADYVIP